MNNRLATSVLQCARGYQHFEAAPLDGYSGQPGELCCFNMAKPYIDCFNIKDTSGFVEKHTAPDASITKKNQLRVAGTRGNRVILCTGAQPTDRPIAFCNDLDTFPMLDFGHYRVINRPIDLSDILETEEDLHDTEHVEKKRFKKETVPIHCVLFAAITAQGQYSSFPVVKKLGGLSRNITEEMQVDTCNLIRMLPIEMRLKVMQYMDYHQVSWLADIDKNFARELLFNRYHVRSDEKDEFRSILMRLRKECAKQMVFRKEDDLWIFSMRRMKPVWKRNSAGTFCRLPEGEARRYKIKDGVYSWHIASSVTNLRFDTSRSKCRKCTYMLCELQKCMSCNQNAMLFGDSRAKVFSLEGTEACNTDLRYASSHSKIKFPKVDFPIQLWTEGLDNRWMLDLRSNGGRPLVYADFKKFMHFQTVIFKNPVRFFSTVKRVQWIDSGILALTSEQTGEVLGYWIEDGHYGFRLPTDPTQSSGQFIGLNFIPETLHAEGMRMRSFVFHVRAHEKMEEEMANLEALIDLLKDVEKTQDVQHQLATACQRLQLLTGISVDSYDPGDLVRTSSTAEILDRDTVHLHETFQGDIGFCTRYLFNELGTSSSSEVIKRNAKMFFCRCPYEQQHPDHLSTLRVVDPNGLRSKCAVKLNEYSSIDFICL